MENPQTWSYNPRRRRVPEIAIQSGGRRRRQQAWKTSLHQCQGTLVGTQHGCRLRSSSPLWHCVRCHEQRY